MGEKGPRSMNRFNALFEIVSRHQKLAAENYDRIRTIAEHVRAGFAPILMRRAESACILPRPLGLSN